MSAESSLDPYRSPSLPEAAAVPPRAGGRPGWLSLLCVLCIVLGAMGLVNTVMSTAGLLMGEQFQKIVQAQAKADGSDKMQEAQAKLQNEMYAVQQKYWWPLIVGLGARLVVAALLLVGGVRAMGLSEGGRVTLLVACGVALPFELAYAILQSLIMIENMTAMNSFAEAIASEIPKQGEAEGIQKFVQTVFRGTMIVSMVVLYLFSIAKIGLYVFGLLYLQRPHIKSLFHTAPYANPAPYAVSPGP
jgi:hypothetical protein